MLRATQISLANILALALVVAVFIVGNAVVAFIAIQAVAVYAFAKILTGKLPSALQIASTANCRRLDGSWSTNREAIERKSQQKVFYDVILVLLFIVVPSNVLLLYVNDEVFPLAVGFDAISSFRASPKEWKANLRDEESRLEMWGRQRHLSRDSIEIRKRSAWHSWPVLAVGGFAWLLVCFNFFNRTYQRSIRELANEIQFRADEYLVHDLTRPRSRKSEASSSRFMV